MRVASAFGTPARADAGGFENPYGRQSAETRASGIFDGSGRREARTRKRRAPDGGATHRARRGCSRRLESGRDARGFTTACGECREDAGGDGENPFPGWHNDRVRIFSSRDFLRLATPGRAHAVDRYRRDVSRRRGNSRVKDPWKKKARKSPLVTSPRVAPPHSETRRLANPRASPPRSPQGSQPTRFSRLVASLDAFAVVRSSRSGVRRLALPRKGASRSFTLARPAGLFRRAPGCQRARFKRSGEDGVHRKYCRRARRHVSVR